MTKGACRSTGGKYLLVFIIAILLSILPLAVAACEDLGTGAVSSENTATADTLTTSTSLVETGEAAGTEGSASGVTPSSSSSTSPSSNSTTTLALTGVPQTELVPMTTSTPWTRAENGSQYLQREGYWILGVHPSASGSYYAIGQGQGAKAEIRFWGTRVRLVGFTGRDMGMAKLTLDGGPSVYVDLYEAEGGSKVVWWSGMLEHKPHTVEIEWTGTKNPDALDTRISIDAVDVVGVLL